MQRLPEGLKEKLCAWYDAGHRDLPWRQDREPHHVAVGNYAAADESRGSQGLLRAVLTELPTIAALADCPPDRLTKLWEGLGYYSRVRNLQKAAKIIMEESGGVFPKTYDAVRALPGIGDYTAGAICSICFELPTPAVDGNVLQVLSRVMEDSAPVTNQKTKNAYREALVPVYENGPRGTLTQALMELGGNGVRAEWRAAVRRLPAEGVVPCKCARHVGSLSSEGREKAEARGGKTVFYLICEDCLAVRKRESRGLLAGLWELPNVEGKLDAGQALCYVEDAGCEPAELLKSVERVHVFTHIIWRMRCYYMVCRRKSPEFVWSGCAKTARGCGAADGVSDVCGGIKKFPAQSFLREGTFVSVQSADVRQRRKTLLKLLVGGNGVGHGAVVVRLVGVEIEVARAGQTEENCLFLTGLPASERFVDCRADGVAGFGGRRMPSTRAKYSAAAKTLVCSTARASIRPS